MILSILKRPKLCEADWGVYVVGLVLSFLTES